ncbi:ABC transporter substrate-binding protein [Phreatobacter sp. AB_2022a]|uniref:ABC transporter substrate-binding protein n=1 Tax=Phreatobacter sp. AB_2022a TaxID=3003134 RepID=UPI0022872631|nr:ABC transporter substrate-binding protein [Phreatobacter sp. AB_2022a]MCZ0733926.1 ABC transporter substrate-binding protein [Phreatobacter sp. AB_2022a]
MPDVGSASGHGPRLSFSMHWCGFVRCWAANLAMVAGLLLAMAPRMAAAQSTLRIALHSDLKIVDPIWTTALITTYHGFMVYDTLFALDETMSVRPQMVDRWSVSDDKLTYTFTLRDGLEWHDGQPVTAEDCVASLRRWGARDGLGQTLMEKTAELAAVDAKTFTLRLKEPYGLVLSTLGKVSSSVPFMMPKRIAETDPNTQITETIGSGPFIFVRDQWKPGERAVYIRNPRYRPRAEPPSGMAGGKVVRVDRVEWIWISDAQTQVSALLQGEIDIVEAPPHDLLPLLEKDPNVALKVLAPMGRQYALRFNVLHKPFDDPRIRQAVVHALNQRDFLEATIGDARYFVTCKSLFPCGSPLATTAGFEDRLESNFARARALLQEAGYDGTPVVLMQSTDVASLANLAPVAKALMERAGFRVDLQAMDWQTLVTRRARKDAPAAGGWSIFLTSWGSIDVLDPAATAFLNASCERATFGWPCDAELQRLRDAFAREADPEKQKALAEAVQRRAAVYPTHVQLGQYLQPTAYRRNISGLLAASNLALWNVEKR